MLIDKPGIYDLTAEQYHADPVPGGSLSSTAARTLVNDCPALMRHEQDNPVHKRDFDIGTATHLLVLEPELFARRVVLLDYDDYKSKAAQTARIEAWRAGVTPLINPDAQLVRDMRDAVRAHPIAGQAFTGGLTERSLFWFDEEYRVWCRTRPDWLPEHGRYLVDLKTAMSSDPAEFMTAAADLGYYMQAAWYLDGVAAATPMRPKKFFFAVVSKKPPHLVTIHEVSEEALYWGRLQNRYARGVFAWCQRNKKWPGYTTRIDAPDTAFPLNLPAWHVRRLQDRFDAGGWEPPTIDHDPELAKLAAD